MVVQSTSWACQRKKVPYTPDGNRWPLAGNPKHSIGNAQDESLNQHAGQHKHRALSVEDRALVRHFHLGEALNEHVIDLYHFTIEHSNTASRTGRADLVRLFGAVNSETGPSFGLA